MRIHRPLIHRLLVVYLILQNPLSGLVLCWGDNDHIAIEMSSMKEGWCRESSFKDKQILFEDEDLNSPSSCTDCWDIPLMIQSHADFIFSTRLEMHIGYPGIPAKIEQPFGLHSSFIHHRIQDSSTIPIPSSILCALQNIRLII